MNLLFPRLTLKQAGQMLLFAISGALVAGAYGIAHDQITYSLGPEYFTRFKFAQFAATDLGWPRRLFVAQIGFMATWWVGFFAAWFMARLAVPAWPLRQAACRVAVGTLIIIATAVTFGAAAYLIALATDPAGGPIADLAAECEVSDVASFRRAGWIHNGSYLGGLVGLIIALLLINKQRRAYRRNNSGGANVLG